MLEFVLGRAGSGKTTFVRKMLAELENRQAILLVPEQYTFESERALLEEYGIEIANRVKVLSFTRLADSVFLRYGGNAGKKLTEGGRRILMTLAIEGCADRLTLFEKSASAGRMTDTMLNAVSEMKLCGITPEILTSTAAVVREENLSLKLREFALIFGAYEALVAQSWLDPMDDLTRLDRVLSQHGDFFRNAVIAVDAFDGFTVQEYRILNHMLRHADRVCVTLCCDDLDTSKKDLFSTVRRTASRLMRMARENGVSVAAPVYCRIPHRFKNEELCAVENMLSTGAGDARDNGHVTVFRGISPYEEVDYTAAAIRELILSGQYRYRDISVICRDAQRYTRLLSSALRRWDIPAFISEARAIDNEPLMRFVLSAFDVVNRGWQSDDVLNILKTGLTEYTAEEIAELENYIFTWKLNGRKAWLNPFEKHPDGYGKPFDDAVNERLAALDRLRTGITVPLTKFAGALRDGNGLTLSGAVYTLLTDFEVDKTMPQFLGALERAGHPELKQAQVRLWDLLMEVLDQMAGVLGEQPINGEKYSRLLREIISGEDISDIPQSVDSITFGTADRIRQSAPKVVFLLGAVQGEFPMIPSANGIFSDMERRVLLELELPMSDTLEERLLQERFLAYSAMCSASERLYLTYPAAEDKEVKTASELVTAARNAVTGLPLLQDLPPEFYANAPEAAFSQTASLFLENTEISATLKAVFSEIPDYAGRLSGLGAVDRMANAKLSSDTAKSMFGAKKFYSASQIETYHQCKFRYFCRYGIGAKERRAAELDALQYGTLMHYLFEKIIGDPETPAVSLTEKELTDRVELSIRQYADEKMGGYQVLSAQEKYRFDRMAQTAVKLILHVAAEMRVSKFKPSYFELPLEFGSPFPPLRIPTENGMVSVGGVIDRVDLYKSERGTYVRVIDYKTGHRDFKLTDVLFGMSLQMLIYLTALSENTLLQPAGILYMPSFLTQVNSDKTETAEELLESMEKKLRMNGAVLEDIEIIRAMEAGIEGKFIPVVMKKNGELRQSSALLKPKAMELVMKYVKRIIATMAETLYEGDVSAKPLMKNMNACAWCPYTAVCGSELAGENAETVRFGNQTVLEQMEQETGGEADGSEMD